MSPRKQKLDITLVLGIYGQIFSYLVERIDYPPINIGAWYLVLQNYER